MDKESVERIDTIVIERADSSDLPHILKLQYVAYQSEAEIYNDSLIQPLLQTLGELEDEYRIGLVLKAMYCGKLVGSVRGKLEHGMLSIGKLIVDPSFQNRGIGKELMNAMEQAFQGVEEIQLFTGHRSEKNLALYGKLGYTTVKKTTIHEGLTIVHLSKKTSETTSWS